MRGGWQNPQNPISGGGGLERGWKLIKNFLEEAMVSCHKYICKSNIAKSTY